MSGGGDDLPHEEHEEHANHESWVIPYADLLTLLMAMFIALFAISSVNKDKAKAMAAGFNQVAHAQPLSGLFSDSAKGKDLIDGSGQSGSGATNGQVGPSTNANTQAKVQTILDSKVKLDVAKSQQRQVLSGVEQKIKDAAKKLGIADKLSFDMQERGLVVRIVTDKVLFNNGDAQLQAPGMDVLKVVGEALRGIDNPLLIEGHTDNVHIHTAMFPSNWELSTARASAVLRYLTDTLGLDASRMRPTGWAELRPIASNLTAAGRARNRRVEIVVQSTAIDQLLQGNNLTDKSIPDSTGSGQANTTPNLDQVVGDLSKGG